MCTHCAVGSGVDGRILTSANGVGWTEAPLTTSLNLWGVASNGTKNIVVGGTGDILIAP